MTYLRLTLTCLVLLQFALPAGAQPLGPGTEAGPPGMGGPPGPGGPPFFENLFPPNMIMRHQSEIGLTDEQRSAITKQMEDSQKGLVRLQWDVERESEKLGKLLEGTQVDETAALKQADQVMNAEQRLKKAHLALLIRMKNELTAVQQQKLRQLRAEHHRNRPH